MRVDFLGFSYLILEMLLFAIHYEGFLGFLIFIGARNLLLRNFPLLINFKIFSYGVIEAVEELDSILAFNNILISLKNHPDVDHFAQGVGPVSLLGKLLD